VKNQTYGKCCVVVCHLCNVHLCAQFTRVIGANWVWCFLPAQPLGAFQLQTAEDASKGKHNPTLPPSRCWFSKVWEWSVAKFPSRLVGHVCLVGTRNNKTIAPTPMNLSTKANRSVVVLKNVGGGVHGQISCGTGESCVFG
jgi:hypothetical protein